MLGEAFSQFIGAAIERELKTLFRPIAPYLRKLTIGVTLMLVSVGLWLIGLLFFLLTLFFGLASLMSYATAAAWSGAIAWVIAVILVIIGLATLRQPR